MNNNKITSWVLERYLLGELSSEKMKELKKQLDENPELAGEIERLKKANTEILKQYPPDSIIPKILSRYETEKNRKKIIPETRPVFMKRFLYASPVLASALVLLLVVLHNYKSETGSPERVRSSRETRIKGTKIVDLTKPHLIIHRKNKDSIERLENGDKAKTGDLLQIAYVSAGESYGTIFSVDGNCAVTLHFPGNEKESTILLKNKEALLGSSYELDDSPEFERFFFVTAKSEIDVANVLKKAEALAKDPKKAKKEYIELPETFSQFSILIMKGDSK